MVVGDYYIMKLLVLEKNDRIIKIYKKIIAQKNYKVEFVPTLNDIVIRANEIWESDCARFDAIILEDRNMLIEGNLTKIMNDGKPHPQFLYLFESTNEMNSDLTSKALEIIDKPFSMIKVLNKMQIQKTNQILV